MNRPKDFPFLIGIHGRAHTGKDTVASYLEHEKSNFWIESFAAPLKAAASAAFGIPLEHFSSPATKEVKDPYWQVSPRQIAQFLGTECFREQLSKLILAVGNDFWIQRMHGRLIGEIDYEYPTYSAYDTVVIPDVRFQNEYDYIISKGGIIIHLTRKAIPDTVGIPGHQSEQPINLHYKERTYRCENNGTYLELYESIDSILSSLPSPSPSL